MGVLEFVSYFVRIYIYLPHSLGFSELTPNINLRIVDGDVGVSGMAFHVIVSVPFLTAPTVIPNAQPKERASKTPRARVCPHMPLQSVDNTA